MVLDSDFPCSHCDIIIIYCFRCVCVCVSQRYYLLEDAGRYERTAGVEGSGPTHVKVSLIKWLQNSQEVSTLQLDRDGQTHTQRRYRERNHNVRHNGT